MNDEKKKGGKPIGGISQQYTTFGNPEVQTVQGSEVQTSRPPEGEILTAQVSKGSEVQTSKSPEVPIASTPNVKRSKHPDWKQQTIYLPPHLRMWLRVLATQSETEVSEIVRDALLMYKRELESR